MQAWLGLAEAGRFQAAWERLIHDDPMPAVHGRVCYHPCETSCNRAELDCSVSIHAVKRLLGDQAVLQGWKIPAAAPAYPQPMGEFETLKADSVVLALG